METTPREKLDDIIEPILNIGAFVVARLVGGAWGELANIVNKVQGD